MNRRVEFGLASRSRFVLLVAGCMVVGTLAGCQQEMSRTDKGYSIPSFKGVTTGLNSPGSSSGSASSQQKP
jgi:hypothetical protein